MTHISIEKTAEPGVDYYTVDPLKACRAAAKGEIVVKGTYDVDELGSVSNVVAGGTGNGVPTEL